jgi:tRNA A-37 threonylcarbamoyl transferase component Bud32
MPGLDPTAPSDSGAAPGEGPIQARPPAAEATLPDVADLARTPLAPTDPSRGPGATRSFTDPGPVVSSLTDDTRTSLPDSPRPAAAPGSLSGYDLLVPLGEGGMGMVWKARQVKLNRVVALKMVLGEHRAGAKELIRFLAEAEAVAAVRHPHVVQVYEYGDAGGRPFLAMEYLPDGSLTDRLKQAGRFDPKGAAGLVGTLAGAVQAAHDLGIVHRDLKPANVLFDERGRPKVTDFGLAKRAGGSDLTATQAVMGTPAYMAPEQARGDTKFVGPQADVYSLGVILYECLTGARPFEAPDNLALMRKVVDEEPDRPGKRVPGLPLDVELICLKCLAKDPAERYPSAKALAADLARFEAGEPVSVRAAGLVERAAKWARRKPTLAAAYTLGLLAVLLGGLGGVAAWQWRAAERARDGEALARSTAERARDGEALARAAAERARAEAERQRERFERFDYGRTMQVAHQEWREGNATATCALLDSTRIDHRGWEWLYVRRLCRTELLALEGHTYSISSASFSPDGARLVTTSYEGTARVWDAKTGAEALTLKGHTGHLESASFSPDGSRVVTASEDKTARVWDAKTGAEVLTLKGHTNGVPSASFSPDGSRVVTGSWDKTAKVWDAKTGAETLTLKGHAGPIASASFSPDGSRVVTASEDKTARVWDAKTGAEDLTLKGHTGPITSASFSPDGSRVVTASEDKTARVWDAKTGAEALTLKGHTGRVQSASFSPDGWRVVTASLDGTAKVWDATPINREFLARELAPPPRAVRK